MCISYVTSGVSASSVPNAPSQYQLIRASLQSHTTWLQLLELETAHMGLRFPYATANVLCMCPVSKGLCLYHITYTSLSDLNDVMCGPKQKLYAIKLMFPLPSAAGCEVYSCEG